MSDKKPQIGEICWNALMTSDTKKASEFYGSLLGWKTLAHEVDNITYTMFKLGEKDIGGMMQITSDQMGKVPSHWTSYINVDDLDAMVNKAKSLGATIVVPATQVSDYGRFAVIKDPTGAQISLWQSLKDCA